MEIELRDGSVYAVLRGPVEVLGNVQQISPDKLSVMGRVPKVVEADKEQQPEVSNSSRSCTRAMLQLILHGRDYHRMDGCCYGNRQHRSPGSNLKSQLA